MFSALGIWIAELFHVFSDSLPKRAGVWSNEKKNTLKYWAKLCELDLSAFCICQEGYMQAGKTWEKVFFMVSPEKMVNTVALEKQDYSHVLLLGRKYGNCSYKYEKYCLLKC